MSSEELSNVSGDVTHCVHVCMGVFRGVYKVKCPQMNPLLLYKPRNVTKFNANLPKKSTLTPHIFFLQPCMSCVLLDFTNALAR